MRFVKYVPADNVVVDTYLPDEDKFVVGVSYRAETVVLRLSYEKDGYPGTSLILPLTEKILVED